MQPVGGTIPFSPPSPVLLNCKLCAINKFNVKTQIQVK